ncbi:uncharacterized protein LOC113868454 [Abrus precatorius]|uniref:Uncharacterized protein LOC113868454 n=1 Tax=Abrus precatorius TaxID=3816 RepID=A0A8B8LVV7_ABRPR|nr:uncharacterized protein LOC113868454 [Abrus precatorius]
MAATDCEDEAMASRLLDIGKKVGLVVHGNDGQVREKLIGMEILTTGNLCIVVNVYASCRLSEKRKLWDDLLMTRKGFGKFMWCILGDFNAVRQVKERKVCQTNHADASMMSRLDRVLVSSSLLDYWGDGFIQVLSRDVSDHCPIILKHKVVNWGVVEVVEEAWKRDITLPWAAQRASQRLRSVKISLKKWTIEVFENVDKVISDLTIELSLIDNKNSVMKLSNVEKERQQILVEDIWKARKNRESLIAQKAQNEGLVNAFLEEEVRRMILECEGDKSPRPDAKGLGVLMQKAVACGLFSGVKIGIEGPDIFLLQFANETLIMGEVSVQNLWTLKAVKWEMVYRPQKNGGLGIRNMQWFN